MNETPALNKAAIQHALALDLRSMVDISVFDELPSTNAYLLKKPVAPGTASLCVAEFQTAGRGRRGNRWQSAAQKNIILSLGWSFQQWPEAITGLSLAVGMVLAEQLNKDFQLPVKVKWPNDLMIEQRKLGGILIELAGEPAGACQLVIGLGLNVHQPDWSESGSGYAWQDLHSLGVTLDRNVVIGRLVTELIAMLKAFEQYGFSRLRPAWNELSSYAGKNIIVGEGKDQVCGVMHGVDEVGALLVAATDGQQHRFLESDVSIRLLDGE